jgi:hypothetical protein
VPVKEKAFASCLLPLLPAPVPALLIKVVTSRRGAVLQSTSILDQHHALESWKRALPGR